MNEIPALVKIKSSGRVVPVWIDKEEGEFWVIHSLSRLCRIWHGTRSVSGPFKLDDPRFIILFDTEKYS